jgi:small neutral amino acid transporter SnatA (MarC family)
MWESNLGEKIDKFAMFTCMSSMHKRMRKERQDSASCSAAVVMATSFFFFLLFFSC